MAIRYSRDCKASFEELSRIIQVEKNATEQKTVNESREMFQRILANRLELLQYDSRHGDEVSDCVASLNVMENSGHCYGCATAHAIYCVRLLRGLATTSAVRDSLCDRDDVLLELLAVIRKGPPKFSNQVKGT